MINRLPRPWSSRGSALITTLLVIVVLTIIVTAFLQSMTQEQQTARSYLNTYRADLAATAAADYATTNLANLFYRYPDSATAWVTFPNTQGTVFYYNAKAGSSGGKLALPSEVTSERYAVPLISGATRVLASQLSQPNAFASNLPADRNIAADLNRQGRLRKPSTGAIPEIRAAWVELLEDPTKPRDLSFDAATGRAVNGPVARYAYWVEDESFRVNVNVAGAIVRGDSTKGTGAEQGSLKGTFTAAASTLSATDVVDLRTSLPSKRFPTASEIAQSAPDGWEQFEKVADYVTAHSGGLNLSRSGARRLNLNRVLEEAAKGTTMEPPATIRTEMDRIIAAIKNDGAMPDFGKRFFHFAGKPNSLNAQTDVSTTNASIYLQKIAANIRDYIDGDSQPTIVNNTSPDFPIRAEGKPLTAIGFNVIGGTAGKNEAAAIGKEAVPNLQEHALRIHLNKMTPARRSGGNTSADFEFAVDHYFEFFNSTTKDIPVSPALGTNPFLRIYNTFGWDTGGGTINPVLPLEIPLSDFIGPDGSPLKSFPAGKAVVLTTDASPSTRLCPAGTLVYHPNASAINRVADRRIFSGKTSSVNSDNYYRVNPLVGTLAGRAGTGSTDYDTHMVLGNEDGILESFTGLAMAVSLSITAAPGSTDPETNFFRGGSLRGNSAGTGSQSGDARSLNEQLNIQRYRTGGDEDQTRFFNSNLNNNNVPAESTMGAFNLNFTKPQKWPDYNGSGTADITISSAASAPGVVADGPITSIGQLGDIYDPNRVLLVANEATGAAFSRGGGRTLKIGQSDAYVGATDPTGLWDGKPQSLSRNRTAWRLADVFSTRDDLEIPGLININGVARDDGIAFRAALEGFKFQASPDGDSKLSGKELKYDALLTELKKRLLPTTGQNLDSIQPFMERGELSELAIFNTGTTLSGEDMGKSVDRGKEEFFRRVIEMITTKGSVFTVHCVGQAIQVLDNPNPNLQLRVLSTIRRKVTFSLKPIFDPPLEDDASFDPLTQGGILPGQRFRRPDRYEIRVLSTSVVP